MGLGGRSLTAGEEMVVRLVDRAQERGADFIHVYAPEEEMMGRILAGRRDQFTLAAHVDVYREPERQMGTADQVFGRVEACLRALRTDRVELFQFHGVMDEDMLEFIRSGGALDGLRRARDEGLVQHLGITGHHCPPLVNAMKGDDFDTVMVPFNVMRRDWGGDASIGLFDLARRQDIGVIIMKPIAAGRICRNLSDALHYILSHDISLTIPGATTVEQLDADLDIAEAFSGLSPDERDRWADELYVLGEPYCRECGYCLPCPGDMNIPAILRMERTCSHYGLEQWIRASEIGLVEAHPDRCEHCGVCEPRCPFGLPIRDMVARAQQYGQAEAPMS